MKIFVLITVDEAGRIRNTATHVSHAVLKMYAMRNISKTRSHLIFSGVDYECKSAFLWGKLTKDNELTGVRCTELDIPTELVDELVDAHNVNVRRGVNL